jgi:hypothetical protein
VPQIGAQAVGGSRCFKGPLLCGDAEPLGVLQMAWPLHALVGTCKSELAVSQSAGGASRRETFFKGGREEMRR